MNPGEYIGKDGFTYRWVVDKNGMLCREYLKSNGEWATDVVRIDPDDIAKDRAALDALIESEQEEWVEWEYGHCHYRAKCDGSVCTAKLSGEKNYHSEDSPVSEAFRAGRNAALEQVQELVEVIERVDEHVHTDGPHLSMFHLRWTNLVALAKKVKL